jgi:Bax protein
MKDPRLASVAVAIGVLALCAAAPTTGQTVGQVIEIRSVKDFESVFERYHYTSKAWHAGVHEVPRLYLAEVPTYWRDTYSKRVPIAEKKSLFFRMLAPVALYVNERILEDRVRAQALLASQAAGQALVPEDREWLADLARIYKVPDAGSGPIDAAEGAELLRRVDAIPLSLELSQGAVESGWGTSRFADVGNSLFGQWSWAGGIEPEEQRTDTHGDHRIAAFQSTGLSAWSYALNLNTHDAYADLRRKRAELREHGQLPRGHDLVETMSRYSERGHHYVAELKTIMRQNKLDSVDDSKLVDMEIVQLVLVN